jgi:hypothetical protein
MVDLPARALGLRHDDLESPDLESLVSWAELTQGGKFKVVETLAVPMLDPQELTARAGTLTCQGEVISADGRLYIDFPLLTPPNDLSAGAQHWLRAMLDAARDLRMVRVEVDPGTRSIHARVDLTGSPLVWRDTLATQAAACLCSAVERLLPPITFLSTSASVGCRLASPTNNTPKESPKETPKKTQGEQQ